MINLADDAMTIKLDYELPEYPKFEEGYRRAPRRESHLTEADKALAIKNALRYIHPDHHEQMAKEFAQELEEHGRIYGYRFRPEGKLYGKPIDEYKGKCIEGKAIQVMIDNNLDFDIALYPYELVTYGETGQVCQNWMQYRLIKKYLEQLTDEQTLVVMSGHPLGLFHSHKMAPRVIISNGLMVGTFDDQENFNRAAALGVANYGQMTAGGWMYIGPQGIVHGTFNTLLNAGRLKLGIPNDQNLAGRLFVSAGLGGMSGAQNEIKRAVEAGYWQLYRYNPMLEIEGKNPFQLDSKEPDYTKFREFLMGEVRFNSLMKATPEEAERLFQATENDAKWKLNGYKRLAAMEYGK